MIGVPLTERQWPYRIGDLWKGEVDSPGCAFQRDRMEVRIVHRGFVSDFFSWLCWCMECPSLLDVSMARVFAALKC